MLPIADGSYIICEYLTDWRDMKDDQAYILVTKSNGIVYKRVTKEGDQRRLLLKSDNALYDPFYLNIEDLIEVWRTLGYLSFDMPDQNKRSHAEINQLSELVLQLKKDVDVLKSQ